MLLSLVELHKKGVPIVGTVHDSILFDIPKKRREETIPIIREVMENPPVKRLFGADVTVPIEVDIEVGTHWSETS